MTIADMTTINVEVNVDETEISQVEVGQPAKVKVDATGEREITGHRHTEEPAGRLALRHEGAGLGNRVNVQEAKEFKVIIELDLKEVPNEARLAPPRHDRDGHHHDQHQAGCHRHPLQAIVEKSPTPTPTPPGGQGAGPAPVAPTEKPKDIKGVFVLDGKKAKSSPSRRASRASRTSRS